MDDVLNEDLPEWCEWWYNPYSKTQGRESLKAYENLCDAILDEITRGKDWIKMISGVRFPSGLYEIIVIKQDISES